MEEKEKGKMDKYEIKATVYREKSISKAAEKLNYTHSAVSQTVKSFESKLGFPIFRRTKYGVEPNPYCEEIFRSLETVSLELKHLEHTADNMRNPDNGIIRIGTIQSISYTWLPAMIYSFSEKYPHVKFEIVVDGFQGLHKRLYRREVDLIFTTSVAAYERPFIPICQDDLMLVTPLHHRLAEKLNVTLQDVDHEPFILSADGLEYEAGLLFQMNGISPEIQYSLNDDFAVLNMVQHGFGVSILPKLLLQNIPFDVCIRPFTEHIYRTLGITAKSKDSLPLVIRMFIEFAEKWHKR